MNIQTLFNGDLEMTATKKEQKAIKRIEHPSSQDAESKFVAKYLNPLGYKETYPETHGCLTAATLITDGKNVWGNMDYQINSFIETLMNGGTVTWTKG